MEEYSWTTGENNYSKKTFVLVIYDIVDDKRRTKFAKEMCGYGFRVQKSAFEALLDKAKLKKLESRISQFINPDEDSVRVYCMTGYGVVHLYGENVKIEASDVLII
jgi:CRISPR-associated protein Cas2